MLTRALSRPTGGLRSRHVAGGPTEEGAVAVIVAVTALSMVLFGVSALAVDLGDAYARQRQLAASADLAALAGAGQLPDRAAARTAALENLCSQANVVQGWPAGTCPTPADSATWDFDGNLTNGEIQFYTGAPDPGSNRFSAGQLATGTTATGIRVLTPNATVQFGFATALGYSSVDVRRAATAALFNARGPGHMPLFGIPSDAGLTCFLDRGNNGGDHGVNIAKPPPPTTTYQIRASPTTGLRAGDRVFVTITPPVPPDVTSGAPQVTYTIDVFVNSSNPLAQGQLTVSPTRDVVSFSAPGGQPVDVDLPVWVQITQTSTASGVNPVVDVTNSVSIKYAISQPCDADSANRGYLDEPRQSGAQTPWVVYNTILGFDHDLHPYMDWPTPGRPEPAIADTCDTLPGAVYATSQATWVPDANCVTLDSGVSIRSFSRGLFDGAGGLPGRMDPRCGTVTTTSGPEHGIEGAYLSQFVDTSFGTLDQFLTAIRSPAPAPADKRGWLSADALTCARLTFIPVVRPQLPVQNDDPDAVLPVVDIKILWIDSVAQLGDAEPVNHAERGFLWNDHEEESRLQGVLGYVIDPSYLPATVAGLIPSTDQYFSDTLPKLVRLVHDIDDPAT